MVRILIENAKVNQNVLTICGHPTLCDLVFKICPKIGPNNWPTEFHSVPWTWSYLVCFCEIFGVIRGAPTDGVSRGAPMDGVRRGASMGGVRRSAPTDWGKNISVTPPDLQSVYIKISFFYCTTHHITLISD